MVAAVRGMLVVDILQLVAEFWLVEKYDEKIAAVVNAPLAVVDAAPGVVEAVVRAAVAVGASIADLWIAAEKKSTVVAAAATQLMLAFHLLCWPENTRIGVAWRHQIESSWTRVVQPVMEQLARLELLSLQASAVR